MTAKIIIDCDGRNCSSRAQFKLGYFEEGDLPDIDWNYDTCNRFYYCPICTKKLIESGELEEQTQETEK